MDIKIDSIIEIFDEKTLIYILRRLADKINEDKKEIQDCTMGYIIECITEILPEVEEMYKSSEFILDKKLMKNLKMFQSVCNKVDR